MGYKKPERRDLGDLLASQASVGQMRRDGWIIYARCRHCETDLRVDLNVTARIMGADYKLWDRTTRCKRVGCEGRAAFVCTPPGWAPGTLWPLRTRK